MRLRKWGNFPGPAKTRANGQWRRRGQKICCSFFAASGSANTPGRICKVRMVVSFTEWWAARPCGYLGGYVAFNVGGRLSCQPP